MSLKLKMLTRCSLYSSEKGPIFTEKRMSSLSNISINKLIFKLRRIQVPFREVLIIQRLVLGTCTSKEHDYCNGGKKNIFIHNVLNKFLLIKYSLYHSNCIEGILFPKSLMVINQVFTLFDGPINVF